MPGPVLRCRREPTGFVSWPPRLTEEADALAFVSQLAISAAEQSVRAPDNKKRATFLVARRDAIKKAVQQMFPASET